MPALHTLFMDAVSEEHQRLVSRRTLMGTGSKLAIGGAVAAAVASSPALARVVAAQDDEFEDDIDILNYALTLEHLEYAFYRDGLAGFEIDDFDSGVYDNLILIRDHEGAHVDALVATISDLGGEPVEEAEYDFGYEDADGFLMVAAALENTGVSAYDGAGANIESVDLLNAAGTIVAVEARHASYLNLVTGEDPFPDAFETPLSRDEVLEIAGPFIVQ
ncbi:MAG: ferritin-like domain-containing protein [Chloroflexota bacterium]|nr:ferritin-like domain-containing protein [Chloroflexota bacterium]